MVADRITVVSEVKVYDLRTFDMFQIKEWFDTNQFGTILVTGTLSRTMSRKIVYQFSEGTFAQQQIKRTVTLHDEDTVRIIKPIPPEPVPESVVSDAIRNLEVMIDSVLVEQDAYAAPTPELDYEIEKAVALLCANGYYVGKRTDTKDGDML